MSRRLVLTCYESNCAIAIRGVSRLIGQDRSLDGAGFQARVAAHAILGDDVEPDRPLRVHAFALLDAVHGANVHAGAFSFADVLHDHVGHRTSVETGRRGLNGPRASDPAPPWPSASWSPARGSRSPRDPPRDSRAPRAGSAVRSDTL